MTWNLSVRQGAFRLSWVAAAVLVAACGGNNVQDPLKLLQAQEAAAAALAAQEAAAAALAAQAAADAANAAATQETATDAALASAAESVADAGVTVPVVAAYARDCNLTSGPANVALPVVGQEGFYWFASRPTAPMIATGCINPVTDSALPELRAPAPVENEPVPAVTPVTTMLADGVEPAVIRSVFNLPESVTLADLKADPIAVAAEKPEVLQASVKASAIVEAAVANGETPEAAKQALTAALKVENADINSVAVAVKADPVVVAASIEVAAAVAAEVASATTAEAKRDAVKKLEAVIAVTKDVATQVKSGDSTAVAQISATSAAAKVAANTEAFETGTKLRTQEETSAAARSTVTAELRKVVVEGGTSTVINQAALDAIAAANEQAAQRLAAANAAAAALKAAQEAAARAAEAKALAEAKAKEAADKVAAIKEDIAKLPTGGGS